ncbi:MAG: nucleotide pyrophosphohydrolase [Desulfobacteraceae bacterium]|nr:nucleotide pyrophosphohydrolase [Desulfobacteraceae bacterium]
MKKNKNENPDEPVQALCVKAYQQHVDQWVHRYGVRYFNELTNLAILMEEVGETARLMVRLYGEQSFKGQTKGKEALADELADIMFVITCIANQTGIDLTAALAKNLKKKSLRDNQRHWNNPKLQNSQKP